MKYFVGVSADRSSSGVDWLSSCHIGARMKVVV